MWILILLVINIALAMPHEDPNEKDGDQSRKILGSSVVTSVSVIMDTGNGTKAVFTDPLGRPLSKPSTSSELASPIDLLNPDRYEFYTFDDDGNLVRRLMSLEEIRGIIATGDSDGLEFDSLSTHNYIPENRVNDVLSNVQGVLKGEMELHKNKSDSRPIFDTPDVSDSWSMILPAVFGNSGADIKPEKPLQHVTPDTIVVETSTEDSASTSSSSSYPMETKEDSGTPTTEAILVTTTNARDGEETTKTEISSSSSVSSTTLADLKQTSTTMKQEQKTTAQFSVTNSQELSSTEKLPTSENLPVTNSEVEVSSTESVSAMASTNQPLFSSSTNEPTSTDLPLVKSTVAEESPSIFTNIPPTTSTESAITKQPSTEEDIGSSSASPSLVKSTERPSAITEQSSTQEDLPSSSTSLPLVRSTEEASTTALPSSSTNLPPVQSTAQIKTEDQSPDLPSSSTSMATSPTAYEEEATTTERRMDSESTATTENLAATTLSYEKASTPEISIGNMLPTTIPEFSTEVVDQSDSRFETTERYSITTRAEEATTDRDLMGSIQELLSQTLQNMDDMVMDLNKTDDVSTMTNEFTTTISPPSVGEATTPSIYQIISSSNFSVPQTVEKNIEGGNGSSSANNDSPVVKITILNPGSDEGNLEKLASISEGPSKNTKTDKTSELNTTLIQSNEDVLATTTEADPTEPTTLVTEKLSTGASATTEMLSEEQTTEAIVEPSIEIIIKENVTSTTAAPAEPQKPPVKDTDKNESTWTLVPTVKPHAEPAPKPQNNPSPSYPEFIQPPQPIDLHPKPLQGFGLEDSTSSLDRDIHQYTQLCNELAFSYWKTVTTGLSAARSIFVSPFGVTSLLAMIFLGARGSTSGEMNEMLKLDDMVTFNPHLIFKNVSESIDLERAGSGVAASAIVRELFSDKHKGMLLPFYKERAKAFYDGFVEEINFNEVGDIIRRRTNLQVKKYSDGKIGEFLKDSSIAARAPLAGISINVFQTDCANTSTEGRDGEMHFVVLPSIRQRRLVPIPAVVYRSDFLAGYDPSLDATAVALGTKERIVSTILVIPGQQGMPAPGDGLARLEKSLVESSFRTGAWSRLLRSLIPRKGLEVQIPRIVHRSVINATMALKKMGLREMFDDHKADLRGMNGIQKELYVSDILQVNSFTTCGEVRSADSHHSEIYPANVGSRRLEKSLEENYLHMNQAELDPLYMNVEVPLPLRPREAREPEIPRLRFDRPFLYFVRHNPTGLILHIGRFNPRLLP